MNSQHANRKSLLLRPSAASLPANTRIVDEIQREFSEFSFEIVDVQPVMRRKPWTVLVNALWTVWLYRTDLTTCRKKFRQCFWRTPYMHDAIRRMLRRSFGGEDWAFTFQIQSLFDGSLDGVPHFVYTDHTHLANLEYAGFTRADLFHPSWIAKEREIYANASVVFVWSTNMLEILRRAYGIDETRMECVFAGVNAQVPEVWTPPEPDVVPKRLLFVGVDWNRKGGPDLVKAFVRVRENFPDTELTVVSAHIGDTDQPIPGLTFLGRVPVDEIGEHFRRAQVFCMPSTIEPFGIVFVEAMAYGLPIVSTTIGALPDLVEDGTNGYLVTPGDIQGLVNAIETILGRPEQYRRMSMRAREIYEATFTWPAVFASIRSRIVNYVSL